MGVYSVFVCQLVAQVCSPSNVCAGVYTLTECVTQCANVPIPKMNTRHHANHALVGYVKPKIRVIPLIPQGHFVPQLYHKTVWGMSSLKTFS